MSPNPRRDYGRLHDAISDFYERRGGWVLLRVCLLGVQALTSLTGALMMVWIARYLRLSFGQAAVGYLIMFPTIVLGVWIGALRRRELVTAGLRWSGARRTPELAPDAWEAVVRGVPRLIGRGYLGGLVGCVPAAVAMVAIWHEPAYAALPLWAALATGGAASLVICTSAAELVLRPMVEDIATHLPIDHEPTQSGLRLRTKALAPLPVVALYGALTVGAFADVQLSPSLRLVVALGIALITMIVATVVFLVITRSALDPLDELLAATERIRTGDLTGSVPIVTADDLGQLARSFNRMVEGLRERESLREQNQELTLALRASLARVVAAANDERRRVERDIHDGAQQQLALIGAKLAYLERLAHGDSAVGELAAQLRVDLEAALGELRDLAHGIYPPLLESDGLQAALDETARRAPGPAELDCDGAGRYSREIEAAVYFCCLEALQNVAKHAGARARAAIRLLHDDAQLRFEVSDDGAGFDRQQASRGLGIQNMADRVGALGGELRVDSHRGRGTTVAGRIPLKRSDLPGRHDQQPTAPSTPARASRRTP